MLSLIVCLVAVYLIQTDYIIPFIELGNRISLFELLSRSLLPTTLFMLLLFYIVFECVCNIFGELSCFADRCFYKDWWNSTTFEEFNRLWNQPVHEFLYRHVYLEAIMQFKTSKKQAQFLTFLFSAVLHELVLAVVFKIVR
jgi:sterol O-acyltransferase